MRACWSLLFLVWLEFFLLCSDMGGNPLFQFGTAETPHTSKFESRNMSTGRKTIDCSSAGFQVDSNFLKSEDFIGLRDHEFADFLIIALCQIGMIWQQMANREVDFLSSLIGMDLLRLSVAVRISVYGLYQY